MTEKEGASNLVWGSKGGRVRLTVILLLMCTTILGAQILEDAILENVKSECDSLFRDRLVPAVALFHLGDEIHSKRRLLEGYLHGNTKLDANQLRFELGKSEARIEQGVSSIRATLLVKAESTLLAELEGALVGYSAAEQEALERYEMDHDGRYGPKLHREFASVRAALLGLTQVQQDVGTKLNDESTTNVFRVHALLYAQLAVTFVLGLLAAGVAYTLRRDHEIRPSNNHNLH